MFPPVSKHHLSPHWPWVAGWWKEYGKVMGGHPLEALTVATGIFQWRLCKVRELDASESVPLGSPWERLVRI